MTIRRRLQAVHACDPECRFAYLLGMHHGKVVVLADARTTHLKGLLSPRPDLETSDSRVGRLCISGQFVRLRTICRPLGRMGIRFRSHQESADGSCEGGIGTGLERGKMACSAYSNTDWLRSLSSCSLCVLTTMFIGIVNHLEISSRTLRASESRYRSLADDLAYEKERLATTLRSIGDGVITTDIAGRYRALQ